ncbi:MAG: hypothetical protein IAC58_02000 [Firmicutes bacterium]|uniref:GP-PDE domain-containing protein n=1 Tax=Candidatus Onthovivens merdipullorum TaxID=2840889 RepID=A0A9D9DI95_9BACL|nr:hypothetical protein [Candidatus Onthovivens merdipullorum]
MKKEKVIKRLNSKIFKGVAHRGLHNEKFTENGLNAFKNAIDKDVAIELDVHLSKDKELIVCHDDNLIRTTSKEGKIENLTLKEIKENYKLLDGSLVPTLKEVLALVNEKVPIVIELKPDTNLKNYKEIAIKLMEELKTINDKSNFIIICFYPHCLYAIRKYGFIRCLLVGGNTRPYIFRHLFEGVDLDYHLFNKEKYRKSIKHRFTMSWTIDSLESANIAKKYSDSITFQNIDFNLLKK